MKKDLSGDNEKFREAFKKNYKTFVDSVHPDQVADFLCQEKLLLPGDWRYLNELTSKEKNRNILHKVLATGHPRSCIILYEALQENYPWLQKLIEGSSERNEKLRQAFQKTSENFVDSVEPDEVAKHLKRKNVLVSEDLTELKTKKTRRDKNRLLLKKVLSSDDPQACIMLYEALRKKYPLLRNSIEELSDLNENLGQGIKKIFKKIVDSVDPEKVVDHLIQEGVLVSEEWKHFIKEITKIKCRYLLDKVLGTKHPRACEILYEALGEKYSWLQKIIKKTIEELRSILVVEESQTPRKANISNNEERTQEQESSGLRKRKRKMPQKEEIKRRKSMRLNPGDTS